MSLIPSINMSILASFPAENVIEIDDKLTNQRKIAIVNDSQVSYIDLDDGESNFFPIYLSEKPVDLGNPNLWSSLLFQEGEESGDFGNYFAFRNLRQDLIQKTDYLTFVRAIWWAYNNRQFDIDTALSKGIEATDLVKVGRAAFDSMLSQVMQSGNESHNQSVN